MADPREQQLHAYFAALQTGEIAGLERVLADDYLDLNAVPGQLPGSVGATLKLLAFRATYPDARVVVEAFSVEPAYVHATWRTTATGLHGAVGEATWRYVGRFEIDQRIRSSEVLSAEAVAGERSHSVI